MSKEFLIPSSQNEFEHFITFALKYLKNKPLVRKIKKGPILYVGDIHGFFNNIKNAVKIGIKKAVSNIVFLGDYSDRGPEQIRSLLNVIYAQIAKDIKFKQFEFIDPIFYETSGIIFSVLRGNHEDIEINKRYGLKGDIQKIYGYFPEKVLADLYNHLPIMAETSWKSFSVHGGIPKATENLSVVNFLKKMRKLFLPLHNNPKNRIDNSFAEMIYQLMWNDPDEKINVNKSQFNNSFRGSKFYTFNEKAVDEFFMDTGYKRIIRSHESSRGPYQEIWGGKVISIFSAFPYFNRITSTAYYFEKEDGTGEILDHRGNSIHSIEKI